jgi:glycine/D-amino acid oxidase-like deaminating enzyme
MSNAAILSDAFTSSPYWWDAAPRIPMKDGAWPSHADAVVVGSGVTGLHAALHLARGGREVVVLEAEQAGCGASTRNNGTIVPFLYLKQYQLERRFGKEVGRAIAMTAIQAISYMLNFCEQEGIDCAIKEYDRYFLALSERHMAALSESVSLQRQGGIVTDWQPIGPDRLTDETGFTGFSGGVYVPRSLGCHPGLYHSGLLQRCLDAGVRIIDGTRVTATRANANGFDVSSSNGQISTRDVVWGTNGYTGPEFNWANERLMPVPIHMAATDPLPPDVLASVFPTPRAFIDSKTNITWVRLSPDGTRALVGGRGGMRVGSPENNARIMHADMARLIPALASAKISHVWSGQCAFSFDNVPHFGQVDGMYYALGYCGVGMTIGSWLGKRIADRILGVSTDEPNPYDGRTLPVPPMQIDPHVAFRLGISLVNARDWWESRGYRAMRREQGLT